MRAAVVALLVYAALLLIGTAGLLLTVATAAGPRAAPVEQVEQLYPEPDAFTCEVTTPGGCFQQFT